MKRLILLSLIVSACLVMNGCNGEAGSYFDGVGKFFSHAAHETGKFFSDVGDKMFGKKTTPAPEEGQGGTGTYALTVSISPADGGSVTLNPVGGSYAAGTLVTLTATAASGYQFDHWEDSSTTNPRSVVVNADTSVTATFVQTSNSTHTLTVVSQTVAVYDMDVMSTAVDDWGDPVYDEYPDDLYPDDDPPTTSATLVGVPSGSYTLIGTVGDNWDDFGPIPFTLTDSDGAVTLTITVTYDDNDIPTVTIQKSATP
jgi:hypothetical protein